MHPTIFAADAGNARRRPGLQSKVPRLLRAARLSRAGPRRPELRLRQPGRPAGKRCSMRRWPEAASRPPASKRSATVCRPSTATCCGRRRGAHLPPGSPTAGCSVRSGSIPVACANRRKPGSAGWWRTPFAPYRSIAAASSRPGSVPTRSRGSTICSGSRSPPRPICRRRGSGHAQLGLRSGPARARAHQRLDRTAVHGRVRPPRLRRRARRFVPARARDRGLPAPGPADAGHQRPPQAGSPLAALALRLDRGAARAPHDAVRRLPAVGLYGS